MEVLNIIIRILKDVLVSMSVFLVFIKILGYKKFDGKAIILSLIHIFKKQMKRAGFLCFKI